MTEGHLDMGEVTLAWSVWGTPGDPAVVLLHGFPQNRALWSAIDSAQRAAYRTAWRQPQVIAGMCADDRATLIADLAHDRADRDRRVTVPALVLWGADGVMGRMYDLPALWAPSLTAMDTGTIPGGHFFPDTAPGKTTGRLLVWLDRQG